MDLAAAGAFRAAGTPPDVAAFYAEAVTALVLERLQNEKRLSFRFEVRE